MSSGVPLAALAALIGDPSRASMLEALLGQRAQTASELAWRAGVSAATTSEHLAKLLAGGLLTLRKQGRHRYYALRSAEIGRMLEGMLVVAAPQATTAAKRATPRISPALQQARTCYDHLAGRLGVGIADALTAREVVAIGDEAGEVTADGAAWLEGFGLPVAAMRPSKRVFCRPCLDWSERRWHLAGALGAGLCRRCEELGWIERHRDSRAVSVTPAGREGFRERFGLEL